MSAWMRIQGQIFFDYYDTSIDIEPKEAASALAKACFTDMPWGSETSWNIEMHDQIMCRMEGVLHSALRLTLNNNVRDMEEADAPAVIEYIKRIRNALPTALVSGQVTLYTRNKTHVILVGADNPVQIVTA
jgi:hypothetical protein